MAPLPRTTRNRSRVLGGAAGQRDEFGDPQARGVEKFEQADHPGRPQTIEPGAASGRVDASCATLQQAIDLLDRQNLGQHAPPLRGRDRGGRINRRVTLDVKKLVELAHRRQPAGGGGRLEAALLEASP